MGFFKNLFKKPAEEINLLQLQDWFKSKTSHIVKQKSSTVQKIFDDFEEQIRKVEDALVELEQAELENPNVPPKVKNILQGNRESFIKFVNISLARIPAFNSKFPKEFEKHMNDLAKKIARNIAILKEFHKDETNGVLQEITQLEKMSKMIGKQDSEILKMESAKVAIDEIFMVKEEKKRINEIIASNNKIIKSSAKEVEKTQREIQALRKSQEYANLLKLKELVEKQGKDLDLLRDTIIQSFAPFSKAFKKYAHSSKKHRKIIQKYLDNSFEAFIQDKNLEINKALHDLSYDLTNIDIDKKEAEKIVKNMNNLSAARLRELKKQYENLKDVYEKTKKQVRKNNILDDIQKYEELVENLVIKKNNLIDDNEGHLKVLKGININDSVEDAETKVNDYLNTNIKIVVPHGFD